MRLRAAIFDMNGTLVDDIPYHYRAWCSLAERHGFQMNEALFQSFNGQKNEDIFPRVLGHEVDRARMDALGREKEELYRALYRTHIAAVQGANALLQRLRARGVALAVASSAPALNRDMVIEGLGWQRAFDVVVANENLRGKPEPDIFLAAAELLGAEPSTSLVFEDAINGVVAARAGGFACVGVTTNVSAEQLREAGAVITVPHFDALPDDLDALLA